MMLSLRSRDGLDLLQIAKISPSIDVINTTEGERMDYVHYPWTRIPPLLQEQIIEFVSKAYSERGLLELGETLPLTDFQDGIFYFSVSSSTNPEDNVDRSAVIANARLKQVDSLDSLPMVLTFDPHVRRLIIEKVQRSMGLGIDLNFMFEVGKFAVDNELNRKMRWEIFNKGIDGIVSYLLGIKNSSESGRIALFADTLSMPSLTDEGIRAEDASAGFLDQINKKLNNAGMDSSSSGILYRTFSLGLVDNYGGSLEWVLIDSDNITGTGLLVSDNPLANTDDSIYARGCIKTWTDMLQQLATKEETGPYKVITFHYMII